MLSVLRPARFVLPLSVVCCVVLLPLGWYRLTDLNDWSDRPRRTGPSAFDVANLTLVPLYHKDLEENPKKLEALVRSLTSGGDKDKHLVWEHALPCLCSGGKEYFVEPGSDGFSCPVWEAVFPDGPKGLRPVLTENDIAEVDNSISAKEYADKYACRGIPTVIRGCFDAQALRDEVGTSILSWILQLLSPLNANVVYLTRNDAMARIHDVDPEATVNIGFRSVEALATYFATRHGPQAADALKWWHLVPDGQIKNKGSLRPNVPEDNENQTVHDGSQNRFAAHIDWLTQMEHDHLLLTRNLTEKVRKHWKCTAIKPMEQLTIHELIVMEQSFTLPRHAERDPHNAVLNLAGTKVWELSLREGDLAAKISLNEGDMMMVPARAIHGTRCLDRACVSLAVQTRPHRQDWQPRHPSDGYQPGGDSLREDPGARERSGLLDDWSRHEDHYGRDPA